jgi:serine/threonine protein kinase
MKMLSTDQHKRPSAIEALRHSWFEQDEEVIEELISLNKSLSRSKKSLAIQEIEEASPMNQRDISPCAGIRDNCNSFKSFKMITCYFRKQTKNPFYR